VGGPRLLLPLAAAISIAGRFVMTQTAPLATSTIALARAAESVARPPSGGAVETRTFWSASLDRAMPYRIYLPPGYAASSRRYPTLYLLHGMAASDRQWEELGVGTTANRLIAAGTIAPLIIVMPEGESAYWVDHATDGQKWGRYTAVDVVSDVDANFRTVPTQHSRAIGGLSMGAHGALQLALNYPGEFGAVGAHSLVLRRFGSAPAYFGGLADFATRDPMQLVNTKGCPFALWIDIGKDDPWATLATQFDGELTDLGIRHEWHVWSGGHTDVYWKAHVDDYLVFYARTFSRRAPRATIS
jgi:S-formylglutathione hydrolase FrmB